MAATTRRRAWQRRKRGGCSCDKEEGVVTELRRREGLQRQGGKRRGSSDEEKDVVTVARRKVWRQRGGGHGSGGKEEEGLVTELRRREGLQR